ncbi:MAG: DNA gyrase inhibitor YacG [Rubripirellula sp.]
MKISRHTRRRDSSMLKCSACGRQFLLDETDSPPFCSERCKMIDLGRWLDEDIGMPHEGGPEKGEILEPDDEGPEFD